MHCRIVFFIAAIRVSVNCFAAITRLNWRFVFFASALRINCGARAKLHCGIIVVVTAFQWSCAGTLDATNAKRRRLTGYVTDAYGGEIFGAVEEGISRIILRSIPPITLKSCSAERANLTTIHYKLTLTTPQKCKSIIISWVWIDEICILCPFGIAWQMPTIRANTLMLLGY